MLSRAAARGSGAMASTESASVREVVTGRRLPDAAPAVPDQWRLPLTENMGTPP